MNYLYGYFGIGAVFFSVVYSLNRLKKRNEPESLVDLLEAANPDRHKLSHRLVNQVLVPVAAITYVIIAWPVVVFFKIKDSVERRRYAKAGVAPEFAVKHQHLLERLSVSEIEQREIVLDPLEAVPAVPFGHLHAAWLRFITGVGEGDELWSFSAQWQTPWGRKELREGYVSVQNSTIGASFFTVWKGLPEET